MTKATKRHWVVTVEGIPGTWRTFTGGEATAEVTKDWDGGNPRPDLLGGPIDFSDLELVRTFDGDRDRAWIDKFLPMVGRVRMTVTKQLTDANNVAIGKPRTYPDSLLRQLTEPETDAASSDPSEVTLGFATGGPAGV